MTVVLPALCSSGTLATLAPSLAWGRFSYPFAGHLWDFLYLLRIIKT